ncbi:MAG: putative aminodeoxychorismate lyase [bacterium ADurb.Bin400]|nr:MAG: putative aminodeoxychorismate lyase [bacterium ADurb.Bin400]
MFKSVVIGLVALVLVGVFGFAYLFLQSLEPPASHSSEKAIAFEVREGASTSKIANDLMQQGLISSDWSFLIWARYQKRPIIAGSYYIPTGSSLPEVYDLLVSGRIDEIAVTIPEGYRSEQIAQALVAKELVDYNDFMSAAQGYEGKLFPDTYRFSKEQTAKEIVQVMFNNFAKRTNALPVSQEDIIIASIVEREAATDDDRAIIAGVYKNRITRGMKLEADPTVQYARDNNEIAQMSKAGVASFQYWQPITLADYRSTESPHNTYLIKGLPPTPISNPGLKSIIATVNYEQHNYLFFLHKNGQIYPSVTEEEHNRKRATILRAN